jgi:HEPN domain-containing protein
MTNLEMARGHLIRAQRILKEAEGLFVQEAWNLVVRRSQEVVELSLKAALRFSGIEVPQVHDVGGFLRRSRARLPESLAKNVDRLVSVSRRLGREREISFYGDEETGTPAEELYTQEDAEAALQDARLVVQTCGDALPPPDGPSLPDAPPTG